MAKRKLTRNDFIGLRMIRPEANSYPTTNSLSYGGYYYPNGYGYGTYYEKYMSTGPDLDPARVGGLDISVHIQALQVCGFRVTEIYNFMEITDGITIVVYNMPSSGLTHAAIGVNFVKDTMDNLGNEADMVIVHDPSLTSEKKEYRVNKLYVRTMYKIW